MKMKLLEKSFKKSFFLQGGLDCATQEKISQAKLRLFSYGLCNNLRLIVVTVAENCKSRSQRSALHLF